MTRLVSSHTNRWKMGGGEGPEGKGPTLGWMRSRQDRTRAQVDREEGHLKNFFFYLLQPPQHPGQSLCPLAGARQGGEIFDPTQLQV